MTSTADIRARKGTFIEDVWAIARRSIRQLPRDLPTVVPALLIPLFFLVVNIGSLQAAAEFTATEPSSCRSPSCSRSPASAVPRRSFSTSRTATSIGS